MARNVRLLLSSPDGTTLGALPPFTVEAGWWSEAQPVVDAARALFGVEVLILRLVSVDSPVPMRDGQVTYAAELVGAAPPRLALEPFDPAVLGGDEPNRPPWARPGGIADTIAWADEELAAAGRPRNGPWTQVKSWNLSSVLRLPTASGPAWCKSVPGFMVDEGAVLRLIAEDDPDLVPRVIAVRGGQRTVLLDDVPGVDQWAAPRERLIEMARRLVGLQARWSARADALRAAGLTDWSAAALQVRLESLAGRADVRARLTAGELEALDALVSGLPAHLGALAACGLPDTVVHGDFHPGNWRLGSEQLVLLDWGDCGIGHPMLDFAGSFLDHVPETMRGSVRSEWLAAWRRARGGSDPERAARLIAPVGALRAALVYQGFLDGIEPSERPYHEGDVSASLRSAIAAAA